ncbi:hypothetical protein L1O03_06955 [Corynebacterium uropygiale]|uniref:Uncharacterized protein n=1 Tax=Corynebacterium uropygiale TaxID=1775911 RepID=A0A9X1QQH4_9CORY|nr:hypothetical protein [Corynebacterium uropygiale]MCF4006916.1 hypothetical protein [Corynebacterium uropygiale]
MSFLEDLSATLDKEGLESRVHGTTMLVPIASGIEIHLVEIDPLLPAANVYISSSSDLDEEDGEDTLVAVVFSVEDALEEIANHVATDQLVTVLHDLFEGTDERLGDLEFLQDGTMPDLAVADVAENSELHVQLSTEDGALLATVSMVAYGDPEDEETEEEILTLGTFRDVDRLFDVLALAAERAEEWEEELNPVE